MVTKSIVNKEHTVGLKIIVPSKDMGNEKLAMLVARQAAEAMYNKVLTLFEVDETVKTCFSHLWSD